MTIATYPAAKPTGRCAATGRSLQPGELYVATFVEREGRPGLERLDYCAASWESGSRPAPPFTLLGHWRAAFSHEDVKRRPMLGDAELLDLFEELGGAGEPRQKAFRYFVALLLVRRRQLRVVGSKPGVLLVMPKGGSQEAITVDDPGLDERAVAEAMEQLGRVVSLDGTPAAEGA